MAIMDMDMAMVMDMDMDMATMDTMARGLLRLDTTVTVDTVTVMDMAMDMAMDTAMDTDTMDKRTRQKKFHTENNTKSSVSIS